MDKLNDNYKDYTFFGKGMSRKPNSSVMVFSRKLDKLLVLYTDRTDNTELSVNNGKIRPIREIRVPKSLKLGL